MSKIVEALHDLSNAIKEETGRGRGMTEMSIQIKEIIVSPRLFDHLKNTLVGQMMPRIATFDWTQFIFHSPSGSFRITVQEEKTY